jgi:hypothetical protein
MSVVLLPSPTANNDIGKAGIYLFVAHEDLRGRNRPRESSHYMLRYADVFTGLLFFDSWLD